MTEDDAPEIQKQEQQESKDESVKESKDDGRPKFKFECQRTGDCCKREVIPISLNDIQRWGIDQTIFRVLYHLEMVADEDGVQIQLKKDDDGYCMLYHRDNKACTIHYNKPLFCKSYPLGFNGENYFVRSSECTGVGKGKMTKDELKQMRSDAEEDYKARKLTSDVLPALQGIIYKQLTEESQRIIEQLSEEDRDKINKMFKGNSNDQ